MDRGHTSKHLSYHIRIVQRQQVLLSNATVHVSALNCNYNRFRVDFYHADRAAEDKARVHREWSAGRIHLICATIAFGMGEYT